ncbi:MAG: ArnT family glycosyltransferase [Bdellovibrionota bacterium]|jgi:4-amino-4-deoxy-L-arabinose transferase-like glycosyltransferase
MMLNKKQIHIITLGVFSFIVAVFACGVGYHGYFTPQSALGVFSKIHGDSWLEDGAAMSFSGLAERGNRVDLRFTGWYPKGLPPAKIRASVCGDVVAEFDALPNLVQSVYLKGTCEPREVTFKILNPFQVSAKDSRQLGAQLISAKVTSRLGVPIVNLKSITSVGIVIFILTILTYCVLLSFSTKATCFALLTPICAIFCFESATLERPDKLIAIGLFCGAVLAGMLLRKKDFDPKDQSCHCCIRYLLIFALLTAASLRFYGITFGLPANYHPDEVPKYNAIMSMYNGGTLDPNYFKHPSLLLYSTYFANVVVHYFLSLFGSAREWGETLILSGRFVSATAGTLSVFFVYIIGKRLFSRGTGLIAAWILAVLPLHVTCSRYVKEDALLTCFVLATVVVVLKAVYEDKKYLMLVAGLLAGGSAGVKYSGALSAFILIAAPFLKSRSFKPDKTYTFLTVLALCFVPLGFLISTPYSVLNSTQFLRDFNYEKNHMQKGHFVSIDAWSYFWMYHFKRSIIPGVSLPIALLGAAGIGVLLRRFKINGLYLIALFLLYYLPAEYVKAKPAPQPERYILPCLPFIALLAAVTIQTLCDKYKKLLPYCVLLLLLPPFIRSVNLASEIKYDTREKMRDWIHLNLPDQSTIAIDMKAYAMPFSDDRIKVFELDRKTIIEQLDVKRLRRSEGDYLLISSLFYDRYFSQREANPAVREVFRNLKRRLRLVHKEKPKYGTYGFHNPKLLLFSIHDS